MQVLILNTTLISTLKKISRKQEWSGVILTSSKISGKVEDKDFTMNIVTINVLSVASGNFVIKDIASCAFMFLQLLKEEKRKKFQKL